MPVSEASFSLQDPLQTLEEYRQSSNLELRNELVMHYSYIAKSVAMQMRGITSNYAQVEDIVNEGIITLMDCLDKFTPNRGMKFENYAYMRIRNATIDYIRKQDWVPRRVRKTARDVSTAYNELSTNLMREPTTHELATYMGVTTKEINQHYTEISSASVLSFEELLQNAMMGEKELTSIALPKEQRLPEQDLLQQELREQLKIAIANLNEKERITISLYYYERLKLHEIAKVLGVSESRVSQTHTRAILKMKQHLSHYLSL